MFFSAPAFAAEDKAVTRRIWGIVLIALLFIILAFTGSRQ